MLVKAISYWSFPGGLEGTAPIEKVLKDAKKLGFKGVELCIGEAGALHVNTSECECKEIVAMARGMGVRLESVATGLYWGYSLTSSKASVRKKAEDYTRKMLQITKWLGADGLLVVPGAVDVFFNPAAEVVPYDDVYSRAKAAIKKLSKTAERLKVAICVENVWNKFMYSPMEFRDFVDGINSKYVRAYFDVGNVVNFGYPEQWIKILGKRIKKVHLKDFKAVMLGPELKPFKIDTLCGFGTGFVDLMAGNVNWKAVMKALRAIKYSGPLTAEMVPPTPGVLKRTSKAMDKILKM
ncbi:MAG: sugar phosphate isomerase/epimerase family protein [Planctomycetota bacterium]